MSLSSKIAHMGLDPNDHVTQPYGPYKNIGQGPNGLSISTLRDTSITSIMRYS
jgi:hypothetical protein